MGKAFMFFAFVWLIVTMAGGVVQGSVSVATTLLTASITDSSTTLHVRSTDGFPDTGSIIIGDERIAYATTTATTFTQNVFGGDVTAPLVRGTEGTEAVAHVTGDRVRTVESGMMNQAANYNIAVIADASGLWAAVTIGLAVLRLLVSYLILPTSFLGTDLQIIAYLWWVGVAGMLVSLGIALAGGRRV